MTEPFLAMPVLEQPQPAILIPCRKVPVPGHPEQFSLEPEQVSMSQMPGGWTTVHMMLCQALHMVVLKMVEEARQAPPRLIQVATELPGAHVRQ